MIKVRCASCGKTLQLPDQFAGKRGKCPGCQEMLTIPAASAATAAAPAPAPVKARKPAPPPVEEVEEVDAAEVEEVEPEEVEEVEPEVEEIEEEAITAKPVKKRPRPVADEDEEEVEDRVAKKPTKKRPLDEEEDEDRPRKKKKKSRKPAGEWADCPSCGAADATRVHWTLWGGLIGPAFINTVHCNDCGTNYNGVHGDYNTTRIIIFMVVNFALAAIIGGLAVALRMSS